VWNGAELLGAWRKKRDFWEGDGCGSYWALRERREIFFRAMDVEVAGGWRKKRDFFFKAMVAEAIGENNF
jgi:hypothetical protein